ncbi:MAG: hypothetical protein HYT94_04070 [Parcubacteria group bacterium]|nr:hypothetical protein [Parcubacteria group bacterium]
MPKNDSFFVRHLHLFILGIASIASAGALITLSRFDTTRLSAFGPTAKLYFTGIKNGLTISVFILLVSFATVLFFKEYLKKIIAQVKNSYLSSSEIKKNFFVLAACLIFAFATHAGNIMNGYFNMDDFEVASLNRTTPLSDALFIPHGNDHALPLFRTEMKVLDAIFGQNPLPFNIFIFILFALTPFFTYLSFKKLGLGLQSFFVFFVLFTGATGWNDMLPGFYIMTIYLQIIFFFSVMVWSYLSWGESREKKYLFFLAISMLGALGADISGIWVIPAILLVMMCISWTKDPLLTVKKKDVSVFFIENKLALIVVSEVIIAFAIFLVYTFMVIQPDTFLSALSDAGAPSATEKQDNWRLFPLTENFISLFSSGVSLSLFVPKIAKILAHPSIQGIAQSYWALIEIVIFFANIILFWLAMKYAGSKEKKLILLTAGIMSVALVMVIIARPNHEPIPDFDYRYAGAAFYAYCIFLAISASVFLKTKKDYAVKIIVPAVIIIFSAQQAFGFQAVRTREESKMRKTAIEQLNRNLLSEIEQVSKEKKDGFIAIPNLSGGHIFQETLAGFTLSYYILFFNRHMPLELVQTGAMPPDNRTHTVKTVPSLRTATSPEFKEALKKPGAIRSYYLSPSLMSYKILSDTPSEQLTSNQYGEIRIQEEAIDPEKKHILQFTLITDNIPGNLELSISYKNDFGWEGTAGKIRVDDFTPHEVENDKRVYRIETNLLQLYSYALSQNVSNLTLSIPETKNAFAGNLNF